jgi:hypothetical protein
MIKRSKILPGMLMTAITIALFPQARPVYGQDSNSQVIHMAALLATMEKTVDAKKAKPGETFTAKTVTPATLNDGTAIPLGSILEGHVDSATPSEHHSDSTLVVTIDKLQLQGGKEIAVKAIVVKVYSMLPTFGDDSQASNQQFDRGRLQGSGAAAPDQQSQAPASNAHKAHPVKGLSVTSSITGPNSGTLTQQKKNVHLSNEDELEIQLAVIPAGVILQ